ncbi:MAG: helicase-exonuclease AddAB subunit AddA [Lachnospiraceae bacterium]
MGVSWTKEQQQVISLRNRNILVSAAAGSGKTAVLVERIIHRLTEENPIDVDNLLVVTYTEAAAAEMKERIRDAIEKKLEQHPENEHLQKQATLVHNASITTIHSFCLSVIKEHFHSIDLDPSFRIAEEGELKLLKHDVLLQVIEDGYEEGTEDFLAFVECFATGKNDKKIEELILQLYEFSKSNLDPEKWLDNCRKVYQVSNVKDMEQLPFLQLGLSYIRDGIKDAINDLELGMNVCYQENGPIMYLSAIQSDLSLLKKMEAAEDYQELYIQFQNINWERLASNRSKTVLPELADLVKNLRSQAKNTIDTINELYFYQSPEELRKDMKSSQNTVEVLCRLVIQFSEAFAAQKARKNIIDFGDMEQFALRILTRRDDGELVPSPVAKEYQRRFKEVMIDEYQDSNLIQEAILTSVSQTSQGGHNIFMVGDVKQSIYRFRLSRPELFMEKFYHYSTEDSLEQRIDLHKNFRSRGEVLDSVNFIFKQIMTKKMGGIEYDDKAALYVGADYEARPGNETEVLLVDTKSSLEEVETDETSRELEARAVARRIKELVHSHQVLDKKTGTYRGIRYSDIVILTRSLKGWTDVFAKVLNKEGIPTYTGSKEGYFESREIALLLDYLKILDNPRQDLPLTAVLSSMFGGLTSEELAHIKSSYLHLKFHEAVMAYATEKKESPIGVKLCAFLEQAQGFRLAVPYTAIHQLLWRIMEQTGYGYYVAALPGGEQRKANVDMLVEKAISFETTSYKGLFNFVRYIEQLKKYEIDYGEANISSEKDNTVRLMSIHKSKGLEFPVVFVAGMSKLFNNKEAQGSIVIHPDLGIGIDAIDIERRTKSPTLIKKIIQKQVSLENRGEELRILYVALTRAKEKLITIGTISKFEKKLQSMNALKWQKERELTYTTLTKSNCYYDWVLPALLRNRSFDEIWEKYNMMVPFSNPLYKENIPMVVRYIQMEDLVTGEWAEEVSGKITEEMLHHIDLNKTYDCALKNQLEEQLSFSYSYENEQHFKMKFTVSELKKRAYLGEESGEIMNKEPEVIPLLPKFLLPKEELKGAYRGTIYHKILEKIDFGIDYNKEQLSEVMESFLKEEILTKEMISSVEIEDIYLFLTSDIGKRMKKASIKNQFYKEQPFVIGTSAENIYNQKSDEMLLVQGIIDAYFEEDGEWVVLDYKTDYVKHPQELKQRYQSQLDYYATALQQLTGKKVKEKLIYSFTLKETIEL